VSPVRRFERATNPIDEVLALLGDVVLVPNRELTKKPIVKAWQKLTLESMTRPDHIRSFIGQNIGVLLGRASGGLCTIDIDTDSDVEPFLEDNPRLRETTRTKRVRGCNLWMHIEGEYPPTKKLRVTDAAGSRVLGEWRADGGQTLIWGEAIDRKKGETEPTRYQFLNKVEPIQIRFDEIQWPEGCDAPTTPQPIRLHTASCNTATLQHCNTASLHNRAERILESITAKSAAHKALAEKHPALLRLYELCIEPRFQAIPHGRNAFIVDAVPFLYRVVAAPLVLELVGTFYDCNKSLFNDSRETHMREATAMLESVTKTYGESLTIEERRIYEALTEHQQGAFRICRDLALLPTPEREPLTFFLSFDHLAHRLGVFGMQAQRIMRQLEIYGLLRLLKKGTRRMRGVPGEAGTYKWLLVTQPTKGHLE
jgi:hypothetical protein